jgi:hypothetical protein
VSAGEAFYTLLFLLIEGRLIAFCLSPRLHCQAEATGVLEGAHNRAQRMVETTHACMLLAFTVLLFCTSQDTDRQKLFVVFPSVALVKQ